LPGEVRGEEKSKTRQSPAVKKTEKHSRERVPGRGLTKRSVKKKLKRSTQTRLSGGFIKSERERG